MIPHPKNTRILGGVLLAAALVFTAGPAYASTGSNQKDSGACWMNADTGVVQCFDSAAKLADAVVAQTGGPLFRAGSGQERPAGALTNFVLAELFTGTSYGGSVFQITSTNGSLCVSSGATVNLTGSFNNSVSSFRSFSGCGTRLWDLPALAGSSFGPYVSATSVGGIDNRASSVRVE